MEARWVGWREGVEARWVVGVEVRCRWVVWVEVRRGGWVGGSGGG